MTSHLPRSMPPPSEPWLRWGAAELASHIRRGDISAVEVVEAAIARAEATQAKVNALVVQCFAEARAAAQAADDLRAQGAALGPLHGVPFTLKECFHVAGLPSTLGLTTRAHMLDAHDGPHVTRLRAAGGILLGKTNVSQLMLFHETDNPLYGRTANPLDLARTPGGSSGGEAAAVASYISPLGIGNDLGGSIRLPAAWCGLFGMKPTTRRVTNRGIVRNFRGFQAMRSQSGPLARCVEDLELALRVLYDVRDDDVEPVPWRNPQEIEFSQLHIWAWDDDHYFPACAAAQRAVREAATTLTEAGAHVAWVRPEITELIQLYYGLMMADGAADAKLLARGSKLDSRIERTFLMGGLPSWLRGMVSAFYRYTGRSWLVNIIREARPRSASEYWRLVHRLETLALTFHQQYFERDQPTAILTPAHALPAPWHGTSLDLLPAASYAFLANLLGLPAGVAPWSQIQAGETVGLETGSRAMNQLFSHTLQESVGLPMSVQVMAPRWRDDIVLAIMRHLEMAQHSRGNAVER